MQIIVLTPGFPADESDTTCIPALQDFVLGWKENFPGVTLQVISFQYPHRSGNYFWNGIPVYCAGGKNRKGIFRWVIWAKVFFALLRKQKKNQTVILSYFLTEATYVANIFSRFFKINHIAIAAGQDVRKENRYLKRIDFRKLKVVVFNEKMSDELLRSCGNQANYIIPMGAGNFPLKIPSDESKVSGSSRKTDLLVVSSLIPLKRVDLAIEIINELKKHVPEIKSEIIGDGSERSHLENLVSEHDLKNTIRFTGKLNREEVFKKMRQSKILLHTSQYEGQATVITEALAFGMTVVCFDVGRIYDHQKIHVCASKVEMIAELKKLLSENRFDFSSVIPVKMKDTLNEFWKIVNS